MILENKINETDKQIKEKLKEIKIMETEENLNKDILETKIQSVKGIQREKADNDKLNPFLVDDSDDAKSTQTTTLTDDYWNTLTSQNGSQNPKQEPSVATDAGTQTIKSDKNNGCNIM